MSKLQSKPRSWEARQEVMNAILRGDAFETGGSLRAEKTNYPFSGRLPSEWTEVLKAEIRAEKVDYVVFSYATPIAWHTSDGRWFVPDVKYSLTTSPQQGMVRQALHAWGQPIESLDDERLA